MSKGTLVSPQKTVEKTPGCHSPHCGRTWMLLGRCFSAFGAGQLFQTQALGHCHEDRFQPGSRGQPVLCQACNLAFLPASFWLTKCLQQNPDLTSGIQWTRDVDTISKSPATIFLDFKNHFFGANTRHQIMR